MKPQYSNHAVVDYNARTGEVTISFSHIYNAHKLSAAHGGLTDVFAQVAEEVGSVMLSQDSFLRLKHIMDDILEKMEGR